MVDQPTTCVQDTSDWEDWQRDYRFGLILIIPPHEVSAVIDPVRKKIDPRSAAMCQAHVSVSDPLQCEMAPGLQREIQSALRHFRPFLLHYGEPHPSPGRPGIVCPISPQEPINLLKRALHSTAAFSRDAYNRRNIPAHLTIAEFVSTEDSRHSYAEIKERIKAGSFLCDRLEFIVPDRHFHFINHGTFILGNTGNEQTHTCD